MLASQFRTLSIALCSLVFVCCSGAQAQAPKATGEQVLPANAAQRVVSIGGSITETIYALGKQDAIVAIDTTSVYPPKALKTKPNVGYMRKLSAEGILALNPTLVLSEEGAGPQESIDLLREASVPFVSIPANYTEEGIAQKITRVGKILKAEDEAKALIASVHADLSRLKSALSNLTQQKKKVLFLFSTRGDRLLVSGTGTQADAIIRLAGGENAIQSMAGFKPVSNEAILTANPDVVLMMSRAGAPHPTAKDIFSHSGLSLTKAADNQALIVMPGMYLLGFGPRTASAAADLAHALYGDATLSKDVLFAKESQ